MGKKTSPAPLDTLQIEEMKNFVKRRMGEERWVIQRVSRDLLWRDEGSKSWRRAKIYPLIWIFTTGYWVYFQRDISQMKRNSNWWIVQNQHRGEGWYFLYSKNLIQRWFFFCFVQKGHLYVTTLQFYFNLSISCEFSKFYFNFLIVELSFVKDQNLNKIQVNMDHEAEPRVLRNPLYNWLNFQRRLYRFGQLDDEKVSQLREIGYDFGAISKPFIGHPPGRKVKDRWGDGIVEGWYLRMQLELGQ